MSIPVPQLSANCRPVLPLVFLVAGWLGVAPAVVAKPAVRESFDGPEVSWRLLDAKSASVLVHERVAGGARDDGQSERVVIAAPAGQSVLLAMPSGPLPVLDEIHARMWVQSNRPGVQLAARVVLPRSMDPALQTPRTAIVRSGHYDRPGQWQQLALGEVPQRLAEQVRIMRANPGATIDPREAYIDSVVLVVPGGPGGTEVWTDELEVDGIVQPNPAFGPPGLDDAPDSMTSRLGPNARSTIQLRGSTLLVDGRAFVPRAIAWNGEPLDFLAQRGFNTVQLREPPTGGQIAAAQQSNIWLIYPPPSPEAIARDGLGPDTDRLLAWQLHDPIGQNDAGYVRRWADLVREHDAEGGRPIVMSGEGDWIAASRAVDVLVARHPLAARLPSADVAAWLREQPRWVRPGTPFWTSVPTQFGEQVQAQAATMSGKSLPPLNVDDARIESLVELAIVQGYRGFVFQSHSPLDAKDESTQRRASLLERINLRLQLLDPWLASGSVAASLTSVDRRAAAIVSQVDRARVLLVTRAVANGANQLSIDSVPTSGGRTFVVPGVPVSNQVLVVSPGGLRRLAVKRVAGGTRMVLEPGDDIVLITEDPQVIQSFRQALARNGTRMVALERELAAVRPSQRAEMSPLVLTSVPLALSGDTLSEHRELLISLDRLRGGENMLFGGDFEEIDAMLELGWSQTHDAIPNVDARAELSPLDPYQGRRSLRLSAATNELGRERQMFPRAPVAIISPPVRVEAGQLVEITGWVHVPAPVEGSIEGLRITDSLGGPELALVVRETSGWEPFRMIRIAPETAELRLTFVLTGLGTAQIDAVMVRPLREPIARRLPPVGVEGERGRQGEGETSRQAVRELP